MTKRWSYLVEGDASLQAALRHLRTNTVDINAWVRAFKEAERSNKRILIRFKASHNYTPRYITDVLRKDSRIQSVTTTGWRNVARLQDLLDWGIKEITDERSRANYQETYKAIRHLKTNLSDINAWLRADEILKSNNSAIDVDIPGDRTYRVTEIRAHTKSVYLKGYGWLDLKDMSKVGAQVVNYSGRNKDN